MLEVYQKVFITLAIGFAITGAALFIARKLAVLIDKKRGVQSESESGPTGGEEAADK